MYWTIKYFQTIFWRGRFIRVEIKSTKGPIFMQIFCEQPSTSPYEHTKSISIRRPTCVCKVVQQLFIKYLIKKWTLLAYVNWRKQWISVRHMRLLIAHKKAGNNFGKRITHDTMLERVSAWQVYRGWSKGKACRRRGSRGGGGFGGLSPSPLQ